MPVICGVLPAAVLTEWSSRQPAAVLGCPTPRPSATGSEVTASVTSSSPLWATVKSCVLVVCGCNVPVNVSVVGLDGVGVTGVDPAHAAATSADRTTIEIRSLIKINSSGRDVLDGIGD